MWKGRDDATLVGSGSTGSLHRNCNLHGQASDPDLVHLTSLCLLIHFLIGIHAAVKWPQVTAQQLISSVTLASASNSF